MDILVGLYARALLSITLALFVPPLDLAPLYPIIMAIFGGHAHLRITADEVVDRALLINSMLAASVDLVVLLTVRYLEWIEVGLTVIPSIAMSARSVARTSSSHPIIDSRPAYIVPILVRPNVGARTAPCKSALALLALYHARALLLLAARPIDLKWRSPSVMPLSNVISQPELMFLICKSSLIGCDHWARRLMV